MNICAYVYVYIYMFIGHENIRDHEREGNNLKRNEECNTCDMETEGKENQTGDDNLGNVDRKSNE